MSKYFYFLKKAGVNKYRMSSKNQIFRYGSKLAKTSISSSNCFDISAVIPTPTRTSLSGN